LLITLLSRENATERKSPPEISDGLSHHLSIPDQAAP